MYTNPRDRFNNEQLVQAIMQVDADLAEGNEQLDDWTEELPDSEAADILTEATPLNELNSLLGYIARYLNGEKDDISLGELTDLCISAKTVAELQRQQGEQQRQNAWYKMIRHYQAAINDRDY
ncbi:hypothetical protein [Kingella oralis]|jgi:hypothetical protein|uniref:hypothetical protein n=1 Tax=Kingella oralis TaxID=505 RepID=UPI0020641C91|nr:MAG TPA: hypothetical protein [Caudoviricetes sp.]DAS25224.1 MAG TPA: hypothetical protein [Bacteriophage sp.]